MGRKRIHPEGTTATDRAELSLKELVKEGGARRTFRLSKEANAALKALAKNLQSDSDTAALEYALLVAAAHMRAQPPTKAPLQLFVANSEKQQKRA
jgi:hypothetical protein